MGLIRDLAEKRVRRASSRVKRSIKLPDIDNVSSVGIIYSRNEAKGYQLIVDFFKEQNVEISSLHFGEDQAENVETIGKKQLNWLRLPKDKFTNSFVSREFDILFNLIISDEPTYMYVNNLSRAFFKVGFSKTENERYDLTIQTGEQNDINFLINQAFLYLKNLSSKD